VLYVCPLLFTGLYLVKVSAAVLMSVVFVSTDTSTTDINSSSYSLVLCLVKVVVIRMSAATAPTFSLLYKCLLQ
jgi:hypothetical protein